MCYDIESNYSSTDDDCDCDDCSPKYKKIKKKIIGPTGPTGYTGSQGLIGYTGSQGLIGYTGPTGIKGTIGSQGLTGPTGPTGIKGTIGSQGLTGPTGIQGAPGPYGPMGPVGPTGILGAIGPTGPKGKDGTASNTGPIGPQGLTGPTGMKGSSGPQGIQGTIGPQGLTGPTGILGNIGPTGPKGKDGTASNTGPIGPQGLTGPTGMKGSSGPQGIQGPIGPQGLTGPTGILGAIGPTGPKGKDGTASNTGAIGPQGLTGPTGPKGKDGIASNTGAIGPQGLTGPTGMKGLSGPQGIQGPIGPQGLTGPTGMKGSSGPQGIQGPIGSQGLTGPTGMKGSSGPQGIQGIQGTIGPQGLTGPTGMKGSSGPQGIQGIQGTIGPQGLTGPTGMNGSSGPQGIQGPIGPQGLTGPTGMNGSSGPQGIQGTIGPQGLTGPTGMKGSSNFCFNGVIPITNMLSISAVNTGDTVNLTSDNPQVPDLGEWGLDFDGATNMIGVKINQNSAGLVTFYNESIPNQVTLFVDPPLGNNLIIGDPRTTFSVTNIISSSELNDTLVSKNFALVSFQAGSALGNPPPVYSAGTSRTFLFSYLNVTPLLGEVKYNNTNPTMITEIKISDTTKDGVSSNHLLNTLKINDGIRLYDGEDTKSFCNEYRILGITEEVGYCTLDMEFVQGYGNLPENSCVCIKSLGPISDNACYIHATSKDGYNLGGITDDTYANFPGIYIDKKSENISIVDALEIGDTGIIGTNNAFKITQDGCYKITWHLSYNGSENATSDSMVCAKFTKNTNANLELDYSEMCYRQAMTNNSDSVGQIHSNDFIVSLSVGDIIWLQLKRIGSGFTTEKITISISKIGGTAGPRGIQGPQGIQGLVGPEGSSSLPVFNRVITGIIECSWNVVETLSIGSLNDINIILASESILGINNIGVYTGINISNTSLSGDKTDFLLSLTTGTNFCITNEANQKLTVSVTSNNPLSGGRTILFEPTIHIPGFIIDNKITISIETSEAPPSNGDIILDISDASLITKIQVSEKNKNLIDIKCLIDSVKNGDIIRITDINNPTTYSTVNVISFTRNATYIIYDVEIINGNGIYEDDACICLKCIGLDNGPSGMNNLTGPTGPTGPSGSNNTGPTGPTGPVGPIVPVLGHLQFSGSQNVPLGNDLPISSITHQLGGITIGAGVGVGNIIVIPADAGGTYRLSIDIGMTVISGGFINLYVNGGAAGYQQGQITGNTVSYSQIISLAANAGVSYRFSGGINPTINKVHYSLNKLT